MEIIEPIIIVGVGRSGSSIFHEILCEHPRLTWMSRLCELFPGRPAYNRQLMRALDLPLLGGQLRKRLYPSEGWETWDTYSRGFSTPFRDLGADDLTAHARSRLRAALGEMLTPERSRLLLKLTGWPRLGFLRALFDDAKYIHVVRDGRAVACSMMNVDFWWGWRGPSSWRFGELSEEHRRLFEEHDRSFVALAGIGWNLIVEAMAATRELIPPESFMELRYEDLCDDPRGHFRRVVEFCGLDWSPAFEAAVGRQTLRNTNFKWQKFFTPRQQEIATAVMRDNLVRLGYDV